MRRLLPFLLCAGCLDFASLRARDAGAGGDLGEPADGPVADAGNDLGAPGPGDLSVCGGPSRCGDGFLFCSGFETGVGEWDVPEVRGFGDAAVPPADGSAAVVVASPVCRGQAAGRFSAAGGQQIADLRKMIDLSGGDSYLRFFLRATPPLNVDQLNLVVFDQSGTALRLSFGAFPNLVVSRPSFAPSQPQLGPYVTSMVADRWACVEWYVKLDATANGRLRIWIDGVQVADQPGIVTMPTGGFGALRLGITSTPVAFTGGTQVLYDEVVLSKTRIGCDG